MITTIDDDTNGFRLELIPMALSSTAASSRSLLQTTLALSSFHLGRPEEALKYKVKAIKSLSESFKVVPGSVESEKEKATQFAACMMLCVYSVSNTRYIFGDTVLQRSPYLSSLRQLFSTGQERQH